MKADKEEVLTALAACDFSACPFDLEVSAGEEISRIENEIQSKKDRQFALLQESLTYDAVEPSIKVLYDYYDLELKKATVSEAFRYTKSTFALTCWTPASEVAALKEQVDKKGITCAIFDEEPAEGDLVQIGRAHV